MNARLAEIGARRARLIVKSAAQRDEAAYLLASWRKPLGVADGSLTVVRYVRAHPGALVIAVIAFALLSPRRALRWARRGFLLWRGYRSAIRTLGEIAQ